MQCRGSKYCHQLGFSGAPGGRRRSLVEAEWTAEPAEVGWRLTAAAPAWTGSLTSQTDPAALSARCSAPALGRRSPEARQLVAARHFAAGSLVGLGRIC